MASVETPEIVSGPPVIKEKIIFEARPLMLPTILNFENLTMVGFVILAALASVAFRFGIQEIIIIAALFLLIAIPSFRSIFLVGSTTYVLTNRRLVIFSGIGSKEKSIPLNEITGVKCKSSGLQRFYGAGEILVNRKGRLKATRLSGLNQCRDRAEQIQKAVAKYKG